MDCMQVPALNQYPVDGMLYLENHARASSSQYQFISMVLRTSTQVVWTKYIPSIHVYTLPSLKEAEGLNALMHADLGRD